MQNCREVLLRRCQRSWRDRLGTHALQGIEEFWNACIRRPRGASEVFHQFAQWGPEQLRDDRRMRSANRAPRGGLAVNSPHPPVFVAAAAVVQFRKVAQFPQ